MAEPEELLLPVPDRLDATYLVPTSEPAGDLTPLIRDAAQRWYVPMEQFLAQLSEDDGPVVRARPTADLPPLDTDLYRAMGATDDQLQRMSTASDLLVVSTRGRPGWPPVADWTARAIAATVAEHIGADVIDLRTHHLLAAQRCEQTLPDLEGHIRLGDWIWVVYSADPTGYWVTTTGLRRYGLPELQTVGTPPNLVDQYSRALCAIAGRLLTQWTRALAAQPQAAFATLPATLTLGLDDVAVVYKRTPLGSARGPRPVRVRLGHEPRANLDESAFLTVLPPLDWSGSAGEHLATVCSDLFGARPSQIRHAHRGERMEEAIATARATLTSVRDRFESGELSLHTKLLVKYALTADEGTEYLWAYVTSWRDPYRILATSSADGVYHPKVRLGRPVVVDTSTVVDWAIERDDQGIVEGYWTQVAIEDP